MNAMPDTANDAEDARAPGPDADACPEGRHAAPRCRRCGAQVATGTTQCVRCSRPKARRTKRSARRTTPDLVEPSQGAITPPAASEPSGDVRPRKCPSCGGRLVNESEDCASCGRGDRRQQAPRGAAATASDTSETKKDLLPACGYLLALAGFSATFAPGWWLGVGFVTITYGYALGSQGARLVRWRDGVAVGVVLSLLGATIGAEVLGRGVGAYAAAAPQPFLEVTVQASERQGEELAIRGIVRNTGSAAIFGPSIELTVYERSSGTLVASETAYPADTIEAWLAPGEQAWFRHTAAIPDGVGPIEWAVAIDDGPGAVVDNDEGAR